MSSEANRETTGTPRLSATTIVLILLCAMYGFAYTNRVIVGTASLVFKHDLHLSEVEVGLVFSAFAYPYMICTAMGGWFGDRFGARWSLAVLAVIWSGATVLMGLATSFMGMMSFGILLGIGQGPTFPIATRAVSDWLPERKRAFAQGIMHSSSRLATAITPPLVMWLIVLVTWRGSFIVLGFLGLFWAVVWSIYFRNFPHDHPRITPEELRELPADSASKRGGRRNVPWGPLVRRMLPVTTVYFCYGWMLWLYLAWIPSYFFHRYGLNMKSSAFFSAGVFLAGVLGDAIGGIVSDWILSRTKNLIKARRNVVVVCFLLALASLLPLFLVRHPAGAAVCLSFAFFFTEFTIGPMWAMPMDITPEFAGSASGIMNVGSPLAAIISPVVFGFVIDKTGNWNLPFIGSVAILLFGVVMAFWMKPDVEFQWTRK